MLGATPKYKLPGFRSTTTWNVFYTICKLCQIVVQARQSHLLGHLDQYCPERYFAAYMQQSIVQGSIAHVQFLVPSITVVHNNYAFAIAIVVAFHCVI